MNVKQASVFAGTVAALAMAGTATAGFNGMAFEIVNNGGAVDGTTYRLYALLDEGDRLDAIAGNSDTNLRLDTVDGFYQNANGGHSSKQINSNFFPFIPEMEWDSYITIGALYQDGTPFGENALNDIGIDWTDFESGNALETDNGTWFITPDKEQGEAFFHNWDADGDGDTDASGYGVLIAQVTTSDAGGTFEGLLQGKTAAGDTWQEAVSMSFAAGAIPAPGALALLGLAGVAGRRRRRA